MLYPIELRARTSKDVDAGAAQELPLGPARVGPEADGDPGFSRARREATWFGLQTLRFA